MHIMKKAVGVFVIVFSLMRAYESMGQRKTYLGAKGGYNLSSAYFFHSFNGSDIQTSYKSGYQAGIIAMNYLRDHVGLQAECIISQKGWVQKFDNGSPDFITNLDYLELPLLVNIHTGKEKHHLFANAGCFVEYLIRVKQTTPPSNVEGEEFFPYTESRDHKFGYGFRGGVGTFYDFDFGTLLVESSFTYSLSDMLRPGSLASGIPNFSKNLVLGFSVAYLFSFTKNNNE